MRSWDGSPNSKPLPQGPVPRTELETKPYTSHFSAYQQVLGARQIPERGLETRSGQAAPTRQEVAVHIP